MGKEIKQFLVEIQQVSLRIRARNILENVSFTVQRGEIVTIIGPNGAGKSTLLQIALGLLIPSSGQVTKAPGIRIGYMPQKLSVEALMPLSVLRFLLLAPLADQAKCAAIATELGVAHILNAPIQAISGGEMQRVLLARALLNEADLLVLDEPAQGIDINGQASLYQLIASMRNKLQCGILMVSHDLHLVIAGTDQVICLNHHVCCHGHPAAVTKNPEFIALFGDKLAGELAVYTHHHDHQHDA